MPSWQRDILKEGVDRSESAVEVTAEVERKRRCAQSFMAAAGVLPRR